MVLGQPSRAHGLDVVGTWRLSKSIEWTGENRLRFAGLSHVLVMCPRVRARRAPRTKDSKAVIRSVRDRKILTLSEVVQTGVRPLSSILWLSASH